MDDWLDDPLMVFDDTKGHRVYRKPNLDADPADRWQSFHFATRLKLEGSVYFCSQLLGPGCLPDDLGLPLLTHRLGMWYSHAFFHELCSAYETLLQEINVTYNCEFSVGRVRWSNIRPKLSSELCAVMVRGRNQLWFKEIIGFRNTATHHYAVPMEKAVGGTGDRAWGQTVHDLMLVFIDNSTQPPPPVRKNVTACEDYLKRMLAHVNEVWEQMAQRFD